MSIMRIWAGDSTPLTELPSPVSLKPSYETIWSEDTGRAQSGTNKAKMIGSVVASKRTYAIKWGILSYSEFEQVKNLLHSGFFYFGIGATRPSDPEKFYRSEIAVDVIQAGDTIYYKDASVSVIEQ
jgi:hypothetical protein